MHGCGRNQSALGLQYLLAERRHFLGLGPGSELGEPCASWDRILGLMNHDSSKIAIQPIIAIHPSFCKG
jgi:hypothetical protein